MTQSSIDAVAIRLDQLGDIAGERLKDLKPIVCFATQGLEGARLPTAAEALSQSNSIRPISLHQIERVIFIIDRSESMQAPLHAATRDANLNTFKTASRASQAITFNQTPSSL